MKKTERNAIVHAIAKLFAQCGMKSWLPKLTSVRTSVTMQATSIEVIRENAKWACRGGIFIVMDSKV